MWYYRRPQLGFWVLLCTAALWGLAASTGTATLVGSFAVPWLALLLGGLNLPFVGAVARRFTLPMAERRNHALEHGTIWFLLRNRGEPRGVGGEARPAGFRINGAKSKAEIRRAFEQLLAADEATRWSAAVANECGSMMVVAQGLGVTALLMTLTAFTLWPPQALTVVWVLGAQAVLFTTLRRPVGRLIQRKRLLSLDFSSARIVDIKKVPADVPWEKSPVYFVQTEVE